MSNGLVPGDDLPGLLGILPNQSPQFSAKASQLIMMLKTDIDSLGYLENFLNGAYGSHPPGGMAGFLKKWMGPIDDPNSAIEEMKRADAIKAYEIKSAGIKGMFDQLFMELGPKGVIIKDDIRKMLDGCGIGGSATLSYTGGRLLAHLLVR